MTDNKIDAALDVTEWLPVRLDKLAVEMAEAAMTVGEPDTMTIRVDELRDGRVRLVLDAECGEVGEGGAPTSVITPFLMVVHEPESGRTVVFKRMRELAQG